VESNCSSADSNFSSDKTPSDLVNSTRRERRHRRHILDRNEVETCEAVVSLHRDLRGMSVRALDNQLRVLSTTPVSAAPAPIFDVSSLAREANPIVNGFAVAATTLVLLITLQERSIEMKSLS
jgi:hypothetical protein